MPEIREPSVKSLLVEMRFSGQPLSTGTAFVVNTEKGPHLITNRHNVTGRHQDTKSILSQMGGIPNEVAILHNSSARLGAWVYKTESLYNNETPRWREHPSLGERADFVALPLTDLSDVDLYPYNPGDPGPAMSIGPADSVSVIGFPFGITAGGAFGVWATGFIASEPQINFNDLPIVLIDCRSRQGQSGSPVIAHRNGGAVAMEGGDTQLFTGAVYKFIGIYSGRINKESDLGIVWKASAIQELILSL